MELFEVFNLPSFSLIIDVIFLLEKSSIIKKGYILNDYNMKMGKWMGQIRKGWVIEV